MYGQLRQANVPAFLTLGVYKMHVKDFGRVFLDEYVLYVSYCKITAMPLSWDFWEACYLMYYAKRDREYAWLEYELGNMDEYVMHDVGNYQNTSYCFICFPLR